MRIWKFEIYATNLVDGVQTRGGQQSPANLGLFLCLGFIIFFFLGGGVGDLPGSVPNLFLS